MTLDNLYTSSEAARELAVTRQRLYRLYSTGRIAPIWKGARVYFLKTSVHKLRIELDNSKYRQTELEELGEDDAL